MNFKSVHIVSSSSHISTHSHLVSKKLSFEKDLEIERGDHREKNMMTNENVNYLNLRPENIVLMNSNHDLMIKGKKSASTVLNAKTASRKSEAQINLAMFSQKRKQSESQQSEDCVSDFTVFNRVESYGSESTRLDDDVASCVSVNCSPPKSGGSQCFGNDSDAGLFGESSLEAEKQSFILHSCYTKNNSQAEESDSESTTIEQLLATKEKPKFIYDPENGGGRRRRIKQVSRIEMLQRDKYCRKESEEIMPEDVQVGQRPLGIMPELYGESDESQLLEKLEDCRHPELNTISHETMAQLIKEKDKNFMIIDCRFDYEYNGGHIAGAININSPENIEKFFFNEKEKIEQLMKTKTIIIFHCEFSQQRGPKMYRVLRDIDRRLNLEFYPQIFYPEIYILEGGYREFYSHHKDLCEGVYVMMEDSQYKDECKEKYSKCRKLFKKFSTKEASERLLNL